MFYLHICSSLPWKYYNQQHCLRRHHLEQFSAVYNCSALPLYGTLDLAQDSLPVCRRGRMQEVMPRLREMSRTLRECPLACLEEHINTDISFTLFSDQTFNTVWMEIYYKSLTTERSRGSNQLKSSTFSARLEERSASSSAAVSSRSLKFSSSLDCCWSPPLKV